jgi:hypothetical protein
MKNPQAVAAKWSRNLQGSAESIRQGVQAVTEAPSQKAIRQQDVMVQNFTASVASGKWARNLGRVTLPEWQDKIINIGIPRITAGAAAAIPKMEGFLTQFLPYLDQGVNQLKAMPRGGLEQNIQRAVTMIRHNAAFKRQ